MRTLRWRLELPVEPAGAGGGRTLPDVRTADFDYELPDEAIAQQPSSERGTSRLLVVGPDAGDLNDRHVGDLPSLLDPGDLLVVNTTRVLPARLELFKQTGGAAEVLLIRPTDHTAVTWHAMVRPGRRLPPGTELALSAHTARGGTPGGSSDGLVVTVGDYLDDGLRSVTLGGVDNPMVALADVGQIPLPPYIRDPIDDLSRYQTVFADVPSSVAAPTAGLHFTEALLKRCEERGIGVASVELAIGPGTFVPVTAEHLADHRMHVEYYKVPPEAIRAVERTRDNGGAVVAVGTTVVRALESWSATGNTSGDTGLFITPGFSFGVVDRLVTNFHQPRSTLLVLLEAFMGPQWRRAYRHALDSGYRFLSFGDAMVVERSGVHPRRDASGPRQGEAL